MAAGVVLAGLGMAALSLGIFQAATRSSYPQIEVVLPASYLLAFLALTFLTGTSAAFILCFGRRSARNVLMAGSLIGSGYSCAMFLGLSGLVAPYALSYDLSAVLVVMVAGSALCSFSLWEGGLPGRRRAQAYATCLGTGSLTVLSFGSMSSVLSFGDWMNAVMMPDDITSLPVVVIGAAELGVVLSLALVGSLIDNRTALRDRLEAGRLHQLADATFEAILIHRDGVVIDSNANLSALLGIAPEDLDGEDLAARVPFEEGTPAGVEGGPVRIEAEVVTADGRRVPVEMLSRPIAYRQGVATITALRDISDRRASEQRIRFLAHHDPLTELPNRALLTETLERAVRQSRMGGEALAVLCLDLDGFKLVNDGHGHPAGDELLCQVAQRLRACLKTTEFLARIGGDEFVILQPGAEQPDAAFDLARRIVESLSAVFRLEAGSAHVGTSIGIAVHPVDAGSADLLLRRADLALYRAKQNGRGWYCRFEEGMSNVLDERLQFKRQLQQALKNEEFHLAYQPIFDREGRIVCFEALLRWTHPAMGAVSPERFIPVAEQRGLIGPIGDFVLREACRAAAGWPVPCRVAVNLSPVQIIRDDLPDRIAAILAETGLDPARLELELTEGLLVEDFDRARAVLERLRRMGAGLVLDDFGAGYSSLFYLQQLPFQKIKIDRAFVDRLAEDAVSRAIVDAAIALARALGLVVTAEGLETAEQRALLETSGCHELQGFLLGKPMPEAAAYDLLLDQSTDRALTLLNAEKVKAGWRFETTTPSGTDETAARARA